MRILFYGGTKSNSGPSNINKGIVSNLTERFVYISTQGKYREMISLMWNLLRSDVVVVSGVSRKGCILVGAAKFLKKPSAYIMHGCEEYEGRLDHKKGNRHALKQEAYLLRCTDLLLPVSRKFMQWVHAYYPQYSHKTKYLFNGVDPKIFGYNSAGEKDSGSVVAVGGERQGKNNLPLIEAAEKMNGSVMLTIYGNSVNSLHQKNNVQYKGQVSHKEFIQVLSETSLFVLNSIFEPFSISVVEALACGCSVLVSEVAGITDLFALEETDVIHDPMDVEEICRKIEYLQEHPNHDRILSQFDIGEWTFEKMVLRLEKHCEELIQKERYAETDCK